MNATADDEALIAAINQRTGVGLAITGRAEWGKASGAVFVAWPDGRPGVVTTYVGGIADAERVADVLNHIHERGLPVARHKRVVNLDDRVAFVQERLPKGPPRKLTAKRVDAIVEINDRFAGALTDLPDVPSVEQWFHPAGNGRRSAADVLAQQDQRARDVVGEVVRLTTVASDAHLLRGDDLVHVDLSAANVLFDENDSATAVVDWNLGAYRGDRLLALVQTRFDREWFVQKPAADPAESVAARHLDEILADRIPPDTLRIYWAYWLLHQLPKAFRNESSAVVDWQLNLAESRIR